MIARKLIILLAFSFLLLGCKSLSVSEEQVNQNVAKRLAQTKNYHIALTLEGNTLDLDLQPTSAYIDFIEREGGLVHVDVTSNMKGTLTAFGQPFSLTTSVSSSLESAIRVEENRVYLVSPKIIKIEVEGTSFNDNILRTVLGALHADLEKALITYSAQHPVYVLHHAPQVKDLIIKEDGIEFVLF